MENRELDGVPLPLTACMSFKMSLDLSGLQGRLYKDGKDLFCFLECLNLKETSSMVQGRKPPQLPS